MNNLQNINAQHTTELTDGSEIIVNKINDFLSDFVKIQWLHPEKVKLLTEFIKTIWTDNTVSITHLDYITLKNYLLDSEIIYNVSSLLNVSQPVGLVSNPDPLDFKMDKDMAWVSSLYNLYESYLLEAYVQGIKKDITSRVLNTTHLLLDKDNVHISNIKKSYNMWNPEFAYSDIKALAYKNSTNSSHLNNLAFCELKKEDFWDNKNNLINAREILRKAYELAPENPFVLTNLLYLLSKEGNKHSYNLIKEELSDLEFDIVDFNPLLSWMRSLDANWFPSNSYSFNLKEPIFDTSIFNKIIGDRDELTLNKEKNLENVQWTPLDEENIARKSVWYWDLNSQFHNLQMKALSWNLTYVKVELDRIFETVDMLYLERKVDNPSKFYEFAGNVYLLFWDVTSSKDFYSYAYSLSYSVSELIGEKSNLIEKYLDDPDTLEEISYWNKDLEMVRIALLRNYYYNFWYNDKLTNLLQKHWTLFKAPFGYSQK